MILGLNIYLEFSDVFVTKNVKYDSKFLKEIIDTFSFVDFFLTDSKIDLKKYYVKLTVVGFDGGNHPFYYVCINN